jgi:hypothetical protein
MSLQDARIWEIAAGAAVLAGAGALSAWLVFRDRPTPEDQERARRQFLTQSGRIVDGTLLDCFQVAAEDGRTLMMLLYDYIIGGVDYECSQDITNMSEVVDAAQVRAGFPCSVRYQPGNPQNSIVVAEKWSGLRVKLPVLPAYDDPDALDLRKPS